MTGLLLAQYRIDAELGRGGMGIVYRATDTKLDRTVALKVLPAAALANDEDRARFFREAKAAAQLSHPNVCHVYQVDEAVARKEGQDPAAGSEKRPFIAMEYIEGDTLEARIKQGPLKLTNAAGIAEQIAEALKAAHAKDIVHRDIKSANVMLTSSGVAKVLDFGLAKTNQSTMLTRQGSTLGTIAYMSPEQARGQDVDARSDLYSLGTVLYEMVAGRLPFAGDYEQAVVYGILNEPPEPLTSLRTGVPMELERITDKLLAKDVGRRYQSSADLLADLKGVRTDLESLSDSMPGSRASLATLLRTGGGTVVPPGSKPAPARSLSIGVLVAAAVFLLAVGLAIGRFALSSGSGPSQTAMPRQVVMRFEGLSELRSPGVSPDGRYLVFSGMDSVGIASVFIYDFKRGDFSASYPLGEFLYPHFSPDGRWVVLSGIGLGLVTIRLPDGEARSISSEGEWGVWDTNETILYRQGRFIYRIPAGGGEPELVMEPDTTAGFNRVWPAERLPDGHTVLVSLAGEGTTNRSITALNLESGSSRILVRNAHAPGYVRSGHLVYLDGGALTGRIVVQQFDADRLELHGQPVGLSLGLVDWLDVGVSQEGTLVYLANKPLSRYSRVFAPAAGTTPVATVPELFLAEYSAYGNLAVGMMGWARSDGADIYVFEPESDKPPVRLTVNGVYYGVSWDPDGRHVLAVDPGQSGRVTTITRLAVDGSSGAEVMGRLDNVASHTVRARPGSDELILDDDLSDRLYRFSVETGEAVPLFSNLTELESEPAVSPDGRHIAFTVRNAPGDPPRVVVREIDGEGILDVTPMGSSYASPVWAPDGSGLFVVANRREVVRIPVSSGAIFGMRGSPTTVLNLGRSSNYTVSIHPDGRRILVGTVGASDEPSEIQFIFNFDAYADELAPGN